jgi:hypothetical protein
MTIKPLHLKPRVTELVLRTERISIIEKLASPAYEDALITEEYGGHDPFDIPLPNCSCGARPKIMSLPSGRWMARCLACERAIRDPQRQEWDAKVHWCQMNIEQMNDYRSFPLFGLEFLDVYGAKVRLSSIHRDLVYKSKIASLDIAINKLNAGHALQDPVLVARTALLRDLSKLALRIVRKYMVGLDNIGNC